jgi:plasmid maintenance system antidote protein VapI
MNGRVLLREVMDNESVTQVQLARLSGIKQPNISAFLTGKRPLNDHTLRRLMNSLGYDVEVQLRTVQPELTHRERRSWLLHRAIAAKFDDMQLLNQFSSLKTRLGQVRDRVQGEPHASHVAEWASILDRRDVRALREVLTGLARSDIEMREVSPMSGLLSDEERLSIIRSSR